jgi:hypothetical protein
MSTKQVLGQASAHKEKQAFRHGKACSSTTLVIERRSSEGYRQADLRT